MGTLVVGYICALSLLFSCMHIYFFQHTSDVMKGPVSEVVVLCQQACYAFVGGFFTEAAQSDLAMHMHGRGLCISTLLIV